MEGTDVLDTEILNRTKLCFGTPMEFSLNTKPRTLFLASTVSALHRNAHIWNASHPLLVTYYCWVSVYSPGMEATKTDNRNLCGISGIRTPNTFDQDSRIHRLSQSNSHKQWVVPCQHVNADLINHQITTFCWGPKNSVNAENNESFIYLTSRASVAQLVRARDCQSLGRRFDSVWNPIPQILMNLNFIDPPTRVLNYFWK